ncbi:MAG: hypothetical protein Q7R47_02520 [Candidatus Diapherotrites archaeon]|nr:hypothetical protein [Candidatus Diapherotrites archaeon]
MRSKIRNKNVRIRVGSLEQSMNEFAQVMWKIKTGQPVKPAQRTLTFLDLETLRTVLSDERVRLLQALKTKRPKSLYELAGMLGRKYPNVFADIKLLRDLGLVSLKTIGRRTVATVKFEALDIQIPLLARN